ncbi:MULTISPECIES: NAD(P)/FAD-dependent oxidoreductase [unclassified Isoptericola]|uniref:FAD-dependent oxidoreductase n=1 Tax=unclassified Isoptericola TaxID=2623355 RepID=UPI00271324B8|nr:MULTISPECIES: hypothetical protein [unclassified Isoptericola]MDO8145902.1 hypothetical protein [Isoptericola sp. 178]MDO8147753.1 hypothetical protein [Isoptericola sp. b515]
MSVATHAVVVGGSIAGLLAARVLADHADHVTILERDETDVDTVRRAAPQGHHIHALLARGHDIFEDLLPGFTDDLLDLGVPILDFGTSVAWHRGADRFRQGPAGMMCVAAGRPLLESYVRGRVLDLPNVRFVREEADGLLLDATGRSVTGVSTPGARVDADMVVDAAGRASRTPAWLEALGCGTVTEESVRMDLVYTTCGFEIAPELDPIGDDIAIVSTMTPELPRGMIYARLTDRYALSLNGLGRHAPPRDWDGFLEFVRSLPVPEVYRSVLSASRIEEPHSFRFPASTRRRYERLTGLPEGFAVVGDAFARFNPVYAQGMTVAAMAAERLRAHLEDRGAFDARLFARQLGRVVDTPWTLAAGGDLGFPTVRGRRTLATSMANRYVTQVQRGAVKDPVVAKAFLRVAGLLEEPTSLFRPGIVARALAA